MRLAPITLHLYIYGDWRIGIHVLGIRLVLSTFFPYERPSFETPGNKADALWIELSAFHKDMILESGQVDLPEENKDIVISMWSDNLISDRSKNIYIITR